MSGVNGKVIMSGWGNGHHPDDETTKRIEIIERALRNDLTVIEAAMVMGISERQCYRIKARVKEQGVKGVLHGNRGRPCKYKLTAQTLKRVVELARGKYRGFNHHHLTENSRKRKRSRSVGRK